jgi:hypothetical protein
MSAIMLIEFDDEYEYDVNFDVSMHLHPIVETEECIEHVVDSNNNNNVQNTEKVTTCFGKFYRLFFKK